MGTLTAADGDAFAALCELLVTRQLASRAKVASKFRALTRTGPHPALRLERETAMALRSYFDMFGLNPAGRGRIVLPAAPDASADEWRGLLP